MLLRDGEVHTDGAVAVRVTWVGIGKSAGWAEQDVSQLIPGGWLTTVP